MDWMQTITIIGVLFGINIFFFNRLSGEMKEQGRRLDKQEKRTDNIFLKQTERSDKLYEIFSERTDKLYEMFIDLLKQNESSINCANLLLKTKFARKKGGEK